MKYLDIQEEMTEDINTLSVQQSYIQRSGVKRNHSISLPDLEVLNKADWNAINQKVWNMLSI